MERLIEGMMNRRDQKIITKSFSIISFVLVDFR